MSYFEGLSGEVKVSAADLTRMRKQFEVEGKLRAAEVFNHTQKFWQGLTPKQKRDRWAYEDAVGAYCEKNLVTTKPSTFYSFGGTTYDDKYNEVADTLFDVASAGTDGKPRRVLKTDIEWPTNRTTTFRDREILVAFDKDTNTVVYSTGYNNNNVSQADDSWISKKFWSQMNAMRWGRDTGGVFHYESEDQPKRATVAYGPRGFAEAPMVAEPYVDTKGVRHDPAKAREKHLRAEARNLNAQADYYKQQRKGQQGVPTTNRGHFGYSTRMQSGRGL